MLINIGRKLDAWVDPVTVVCCVAEPDGFHLVHGESGGAKFTIKTDLRPTLVAKRVNRALGELK